MRLLLFNLVTDADDPVLGFTTAWIRALAQRSETVSVITMRAGQIDVPENVRVYSVGKEKGYSEPRRMLEFYRHLLSILQSEQITACFSHMMPLFSAMAGPLLRARGIPLVTWYAHPQLTMTLKLAHHLSNRMVASVATAYPYHHDKLTVIGQGIGTDMFAPDGTPPDKPPLILCAGRLSPVKDHPTLISAAALLQKRGVEPFQVVILGKPIGVDAEAYIAELHNQVKTLGLTDVIRFEPSVTASELVHWYRRCTVHVNLTPTGFGDKVAWEAMSCGRPCLVANEGFLGTLGTHADQLLFPYRDPVALADRLVWVLNLSEIERSAIGADLRQQVVEMHGLSGLPDRLIQVFSDIARKECSCELRS